VRSRACSSNLRAWLSSASLLGTGSGDTGHQRKAAETMVARERQHHTTVGRRDCSCARIHTLARASNEAGNGAICRDFSEWRDPDSNRGHHDFQDSARKSLTRRKSLLRSWFAPRRTHARDIRFLRSFRLGLGTGCRAGTQWVFRSLSSPPGPLGVGYRRADAGAADGPLRVARRGVRAALSSRSTSSTRSSWSSRRPSLEPDRQRARQRCDHVRDLALRNWSRAHSPLVLSHGGSSRPSIGS
jgi:hypothetical protein